MFFMRFPIDALFVDRAGRVVRAVRDLRPWVPVVAARGAADVTIAASGTQAGDDLSFDDGR